MSKFSKANFDLSKAPYEEGKKLEREKEFEEAIEKFNRAIEINAGKPYYHIHLIKCLHKAGKNDEITRALEDLNEASRLRQESGKRNCFSDMKLIYSIVKLTPIITENQR